MRKTILIKFLLLGLLFHCGTENDQRSDFEIGQTDSDTNFVLLEFNSEINRDIYESTNFGEPPQLAMWIENRDSNQIRTLWVSHRAGKNDWKGKVDCPVALPYWTSRHKLEQSAFKERNLIERLIDAVTGATPTGGKFTATILIPKKSRWYYFIEFNISGDYNSHFPYWSKNGVPDDEGNGQPSIIYKGDLIAEPGYHARPSFYGRSEQRKNTEELLESREGLTTALQVLDSVWINVK